MREDILLDMLTAVLLFFLNPLFVGALLVAVLIGYFRVKRERRSFRVRLMPGVTELKRLLSESWLFALVLSILISGIGLLVDVGWLVLFCVASFIALISLYYKIASPIYFAAAAYATIYLMGSYAEGFTFMGWSPSEVDLFGDLAVTVAIIAGLLLIVEGLLIRRYAGKDASPYMKNTNRGLRAAVFKGKKLWLLPVVFLVPGDMITAFLPYWPQFTFSEQAFTFVPVPLVIGFSQVVRSTYAETLFPKIGRGVAYLGLAVLAIGVGAIWMPMLGVLALVIGVVGRVVLSVLVSLRDRNKGYVAAPRSLGVVIAGVLPDSPAERMGLISGECIRSVNGQKVKNEKELYDAIQINAAHCRLQVLGRDGEVRLTQQVIYRHDHHRLGILVVG
ncbi:PDZ domain-containing protein [Sporosarcina sp. G11-34]|uniref:PDZ domain-containing protein n=1 Tax=Sporosarcina sp. G11-34 TaxID=2849605 RepID=UPI0022A95DD4|nr:PDZ domain-containing protein [Sporosarcina sp. G11-34]MCZ2257255.1 PDZ domain-containing protein [Sporosarcina sp. G11-34]